MVLNNKLCNVNEHTLVTRMCN